MKKFLIFLVTTFITVLGTAFNTNAQYIYPKTEQNEQTLQQNQQSVPFINFMDTQEYKDAKRLRDKGMGEAFVGLGVELAGLTAMMLSDEDVPFVLGTIGVGSGAILCIVGCCRWVKGETRLRDLRLAYTMTGNSIVVTF
jgi:hypothetical protein